MWNVGGTREATEVLEIMQRNSDCAVQSDTEQIALI